MIRPARCDCGTNLVPHCVTSLGCGWWRCPNSGCVWDVYHLKLLRRMTAVDEAGHRRVETYEVAT